MRAARLHELEEMRTKLQTTARALPSGPDRQNILQEIRRFRARIVALQGADLPPSTVGAEGEGEVTARARAPKAEDCSVVPGSLGPRRDFRISVGLREGWDADGRVFDVSEAVRTARAWMKRRVEAGQPALSGMFTRAEVTYAWPRPDGTVGSDREPVALFTGEAVHA